MLDAIDAIGLGCASGLPTAAVAVPSAKAPAPTLPGASAAPTVDEGVAGALPDSATVTDRKPVAKFVTDLPPALSRADLTLTWDSTSDRFAITTVTLVNGSRTIRVSGRALARALRGDTISKGPLTIQGTKGDSFQTLHITGLGQVGGSRAGTATRRHFLRWASRRKRGHGRATLRGAGYRLRR